ncbi:MAG TPA: DUF3536 domain-containing protein [Dehalococcoidia bacterium]|nr:DUF3536 domain-containing protein [Dehalococcoidia bacterium]
MSERYVCIHGHFYQPPRENPWLDDVDVEPSAHPFHDWNQRVTAECYRPNAFVRILDGESPVERIVNNYARISFNFGPTLLTWMQCHTPDVYEAVIAADHESRDRFSGHGSGIAQGYGHAILPLTNDRDRRTQVLWGLRDFEHRFGRRPEGMWLPETAVDTPCLETLAEQGIAFTILAPHQAKRIRPLKGKPGGWQDVPDQSVDPRRAYRVNLPSGRSIAVFFYNGPLSRAVAFEQLLSNGDDFAWRLIEALGDGDDTYLSHIATDGETYGHHQRHGDVTLAYTLDQIESEAGARLTNYGEYLERHPPHYEAEIVEDSSWSCAHGIERWRSDCGCNTGAHEGWNQGWRAPLRQSLDWLRDELANRYDAVAAPILLDPWAARDAYIDLILDRSPEREAAVLWEQAGRDLDDFERASAIQLLEMQRQALLMYASCAWFFDDVGGIETGQVLMHAGRAMQLLQEATGEDLEPVFLERLAAARSNAEDVSDGASVYKRVVGPWRGR